jgi:PRC-barrel domain protein
MGIPVVPKDDDATAVAPGALVPMSDLDDDYMVADPDPDFRGWPVVLADGRKVGKVTDLIVDTTNMVVKYIETKVDHHVFNTDEDTYVLVPVGAGRLDDEHDRVVVDRLPGTQLAAAPQSGRGAPTPEQERELREYYEPATRTADSRDSGLFDQPRFWGKRRAGREDSPYLSRGRVKGGKASRGDRPVAGDVVVEAEIIEGVFVERPAKRGDQPGRSGPGV